MNRWRGWMVRWSGWVQRRRRDRELDAELESHPEMHVEDNLRAGMTPEEARRGRVAEPWRDQTVAAGGGLGAGASGSST